MEGASEVRDLSLMAVAPEVIWGAGEGLTVVMPPG